MQYQTCFHFVQSSEVQKLGVPVRFEPCLVIIDLLLPPCTAPWNVTD